MSCLRCHGADVGPKGWCRDCEREFAVWVRRHATDIVGPVLVGMVIITTVGLGLPLIGTGSVAATLAVIPSFGALVGLHRLNARRRRKQFQLESLPRAYLPAKT